MKMITGIIPEQNINVYMHIFSVIKNLNLRSLNKQRWIKPTFDIRKNLGELKKRGYLADSDIDEIWQHVFECLSRRGPDVAISAFPGLLGLNHKGPTLRDEALDFLIYSLWRDNKIYCAGHPNFPAIAEFLTDHEIYSNTASNDPFEFESIRKRVNRTDPNYISDLLLFVSVLCSHDDPLIPQSLGNAYDKRGFLCTLPDDPFLIPPESNPYAIKKRTQKRK